MPLGLVADDVGVTATASATGLFASKNVGTAKAVAVSGFSLTCTDAGNYTIAQPISVTADIAAATLQVIGIGAAGRTYNATTAASLTGTAAVVALGSDAVGVTGAGTGAFANKNVGIAKSVAVTGFSLTGEDAGNYTVVQPTGVTAEITAAMLRYEAAPLSVTGGTPLVGLNGTVLGLLGSDSLASATSGTVTWATTALTTSVPGSYPLTGSGLSAGNYRLVQAEGNAAALTVTPASLPEVVSAATSTLAGTVSAPQVFNTATLPNLTAQTPPTPPAGADGKASSTHDDRTGSNSNSNSNGNSNSNSNSNASSATPPTVGSLSFGGGSGRVQLLNGGVRMPASATDGTTN